MKAFLLLCGLPAGWLLTFYAYVVRARLEIGGWPQPSQPDPKDLGFEVHRWMLLFGLPAVVAGAVSLILVTMILQYRGNLSGRHRKGLLVWGLTLMLGVAILRLDPFRFFEWFGD